MDKYQEIIDLLRRENIDFFERLDEFQISCVFNECDAKRRLSQSRLYINKHTGTYLCHRCGEKGNLTTLKRHFNVEISRQKLPMRLPASLDKQALMYHETLPNDIREYLYDRLLSDEIIDHFQIGYMERYDGHWITIPVTDSVGNVQFMKLRQDPLKMSNKQPKYKSTGGEVRIFNAQVLRSKPDKLVICEGEFDCMLLHSYGISAISSTGGARTFNSEWIEQLHFVREFYVLMDNDNTGRESAESLIQKLAERLPNCSIMRVTLPSQVGEHGDITDFFRMKIDSVNDLTTSSGKYTELAAGIKPIDVGLFREISLDDVAKTLSLTIMEDHDNKIITFLCMLSAYTDNSQINISFNSQSSSGKSYTALQVASLFPQADIIKRGNASPTAFLYGEGVHDKENNIKLVSLERKILLFLEQPNPLLQEKLRPVLSHDDREITYSMTNKDKKGANRAEDIVIRGYAATIVCSAGLRLDEQETTRAILLSSEITEDKIRQAIQYQADRGADLEKHDNWLESHPERISLKDRILAIRQEHVMNILVPETERISIRFFEKFPKLKSRNMRDFDHLLQLIRVTALLNVWFRKQPDGKIVASEKDIDQVFELWSRFIESQNWGVSPAVMEIHKQFIIPAYNKKLRETDPETQAMMLGGLVGVTIKEVIDYSHTVDGHPLNEEQMRKQVVVQLRANTVISYEKPKGDVDKRTPHIIPRYIPTEEKTSSSENNVGKSGGKSILDGKW
jgi:5S rRNA maturation endonuclease (ribonuclease M5)